MRRWVFPCTVVLVAGLCAHDVCAEPLDTADEPFDPDAVVEEPLDLSMPLPASPQRSTDAAGKFTAPATQPTGWAAKVGVDYLPPPSPVIAARPEQIGAPQEQSSGVAWASVTAPGLDLPLSFDNASIETRIDPLQEQGRLGTTLTRSVPLGTSFSMTWQNGYSVTQTLASGTATAPSSAQTFGSNQALRLNMLPTDTTVSVSASRSSAEEKWLRSVGAEQKLFGGPVSITGSLSETTTGDISKSLKAAFKRSW